MAAESLRDRLRAQAKAEIKPLDLDIPEFDGLVARFLPRDEDQQKAVADAAKQSTVLGNIRLLVESCRGMYERRDDGELYPIEGEDGTLARFDANLAWYLGLEDVVTDSDVVRAVFKQSTDAINGIASAVGMYCSKLPAAQLQRLLGG